ncbi:MAG: pyridoxamine 5'-phosphate oxidase family protein [Pseudomonadota bacterium]|nr:pyridoxamine 5'-phosphate oxidase family protein [Pseudomonadota bacterium]
MDNLAYIFQRLRHGVTDGKDDFHTMTFSNIENNEVTSRSVILRGVDETKKQLIFNTDHRSPKVRAIRENPNTHCLFYHFEEKMQLRVKTNSIVHYNNDFHNATWAKTSLSARKCYLTKYVPSQEINVCEDGIPENLVGRIPTKKESEAGKRNFAVVVNEILSIDWLLLSSKGHQRASYDFNDRGVTKVWLAP